MSPHELTNYRKDLEQVYNKFGWEIENVKRYHERDWDAMWFEDIVVKDGQLLFREQDLSKTLVEELIRISKLI